MILLISILGILAITSAWMGYRQTFRLDLLNQRLLINGFLVAMAILTLMTIAHWMGIFTQQVAAYVTMAIYVLAAGFFTGYGIKLISIKKRARAIEYMHRSFWTNAASDLIALMLVAYGIYRTGILTFGPFTGIGITSGLSLIGFGFWGWTICIVPQFRSEGLLILDQFISWERVISYQWIAEDTIEIDYLTPVQKLSSFSTYIPPEDQLIIERLLGKKMKEHEEERKQKILETGKN